MRCIRTAAAFLPELPARLIRTALSEAAAWEAPRTSSPCLWRKSRSARIMFARSVASEARLRTRVRSSSVRARVPPLELRRVFVRGGDGGVVDRAVLAQEALRESLVVHTLDRRRQLCSPGDIPRALA